MLTTFEPFSQQTVVGGGAMSNGDVVFLLPTSDVRRNKSVVELDNDAVTNLRARLSQKTTKPNYTAASRSFMGPKHSRQSVQNVEHYSTVGTPAP